MIPKQYTVYYDGACPVCNVEVSHIRSRDRHQVMNFIDISSPSFQADETGRSQQQLMSRIHAQTEDGQWETGMPVLRQMYHHAGLSHWLAWTAYPGLSRAFDGLYGWFANHRMAISRYSRPVLRVLEKIRR